MKLGLGLGINQRAENLETMGAFSPADISGLQTWYKHKTGITADGSDNVQEWLDSSGNSNDLTQTSAGARPAYNASTGAITPASQDFLTFDSALNLGAFCYFMVAEFNTNGVGAGGRYHGLLNESATAAEMFFWSIAEDNMFFNLIVKSPDDATGISAITNDPADDTKVVVLITRSAQVNSTVKVFINNAESFSDTDLDADATFKPDQFLRISADTRILNGSVYEMGIYNVDLSGANRTALYNDLVSRHSL